MRRHRPLFSTQPAPAPPPPRRSGVLGFIGRWLRRMCIGVGAFVILTSVVSALIAANAPQEPALPEHFVLYMPLEAPLTERPAQATFADPFAAPSPTLRQTISALDAGAADDRVLGLFARVSTPGVVGLSHAAELRAAVARFRATGKFAHVYASSWEGGIADYYLAAAFEEIWVQPMGVVAIAGLDARAPFARAALDALGIRAQMFQRKEYKGAYESVTRDDLSPAAREAMAALLDDIGATLAGDIAADRGTTPEAVRGHVDTALFTAPQAAAAGLVTRADYADVLVDRLKDEAETNGYGEDVPFIDLAHYAAVSAPEATETQGLWEALAAEMAGDVPLPEPGGSAEEAESAPPRIALIYVSGVIMPQADDAARAALALAEPSVFMGEGVAAADEIATAILDVSEDDAYGAIVLRVDSPGGSPTASETIARALVRAREEGGNTIIVSMGPVAASGGYWIAAPADRIFATPTTLTGSIGVVGGKFVLADMWSALRITWDGVQWGQNAGMWAGQAPFTPEQAARVEAMLDHVYDSFVARVAAGRDMTPQAVEAVARGRVWTGRQAAERGLVDELGGLTDALDYAAREVGADDRHGVGVDVLPRPPSPFEQLLELFGGSVRAADFAARLAVLLDAPPPRAGAGAAWAYEPIGLP